MVIVKGLHHPVPGLLIKTILRMVIGGISNHAQKRDGIKPDKKVDIDTFPEKLNSKDIEWDDEPKAGEQMFKRYQRQVAGHAGDQHP